jgi:hypothetical protein
MACQWTYGPAQMREDELAWVDGSTEELLAKLSANFHLPPVR